MFRDSSKGDLPLFSRIPKVQEANVIQQYRPICLLNVSYKIFTKVATNRLSSVADKALDFEKACYKVWWHFLFQMLRMKGFSSKWIYWIEASISGLRQGDPLSPLLFNIMVDMLKVFISRAKLDGQFERVIPYMVDGGLLILRYTDDTILFMDHDPDKARNMKLLLFAFEQASGLKINFHKSSIHFRKLKSCDWVKVKERFEKRLSSWKGKYFSIEGRLTLINSGDENKKKYKLAKWSILCQPEDQGGFGILDLNTKNSALLSKWLYKLMECGNKYSNKLYIGSKPWLKWSEKLVKLDFLRFGVFLVKDGSQVRFWEDIWLDEAALKDQYPSLYDIARPKSITIAEAMSSSPPSISWRRQFYRTNLDNWNSLLSCLEGLKLSQEQDAFYWNLTPNGKFSIKSHYVALILSNTPNRSMEVEAPLKTKILLWFLRKGVILTKDNLTKCNWQESLTYASCHKEQTINHLFFECRFARSVWSGD
ncbi:LOW QUALITY PROTEIN: hypothetical protein U9M48_039151 [Paspalum notatum var. saurae]|uniref:Reverse transcriptase domain-containing protein n=1 Tax=Paspalum notatum var. saurae TaxID=547442 RepID=A0AAQ3XCE0_PASNO